MSKAKSKMMVQEENGKRSVTFGNRDLVKCPVQIGPKILKSGKNSRVHVAGSWLGGPGFWVKLTAVQDSILFAPEWLKTLKGGPLFVAANVKTLIRRVLRLPDAFQVSVSFTEPAGIVEGPGRIDAKAKAQKFERTPLNFTFDGRQNVAFKCKQTGEVRAVDSRFVEAFGITVLFGFEGPFKLWLADDPKPANAALWLYSRPGVEDDTAFSILDILAAGGAK